MTGRASRRDDLLAGLQHHRGVGVAHLDAADRRQPRGDGLGRHAGASGGRLGAEVHVVGQQDDHDDRNHEGSENRHGELLGRLDRPFVRLGHGMRSGLVVAVAHGVLGVEKRLEKNPRSIGNGVAGRAVSKRRNRGRTNPAH